MVTAHYLTRALPDLLKALRVVAKLSPDLDDVEFGPVDAKLLAVSGLFVRCQTTEAHDAATTRIDAELKKRRIDFSRRTWQPARDPVLS